MSNGYVLHGGCLLSAAVPASVTASFFWGIKERRLNLLKPPHGTNRHGKSVCPAAVFFFSAAGQTFLFYSTASIEFTILILLILLNGIHVANKQAPIARTVASAIGIMGIATN